MSRYLDKSLWNRWIDALLYMMRIMACLVPLGVLQACHHASSDVGSSEPMFTEGQGLLTVPEKSPMRSHLFVQTVLPRSDAAKLALPAIVEADPALVVNVLSPLSGKLVELRVELGQIVKQGHTLAILASGDLAQAYADDDKARDAFETARKALERAKGVLGTGAAATKDFEAAQSAFAQADAERVRAQAKLSSLGGTSGGRDRRLILTAPISGVVTSLAVGKNSQVSDPNATLMTITNIDHVFVTANVPEIYVPSVQTGMGADITLNAYTGQTLHAKVSSLNALVEPDTRRQKVRMVLANPSGRLKPNMYATVRLQTPVVAGIFVPQSALLMNNDALTVLVEKWPWTFERRAVEVGDENNEEVRVLHGLAAGERIVVRGGVLLND